MRRGFPYLVVVALLWVATARAATTLRYGGAVGQAAEYRLTATVNGQQTSLGERRPLHAEMEWELRQAVVSVEPDGTRVVEQTGRLLRLRDTTGALGAKPEPLPRVRLRISPTGEVVPPAGGSGDTGGLQSRMLAALLAQPLPLVLPSDPVDPGACWAWEKGRARQTNTLVRVADGAAELTSQSRAPIDVTERSEALGLSTQATGQVTETSTLELLLDPGLVRRHHGTATVDVTSDIELQLPEGPKQSRMELSAKVEFDLRLVSSR